MYMYHFKAFEMNYKKIFTTDSQDKIKYSKADFLKQKK